MHFGVAFANVFTFAEPEAARAIATIAEEAGFESLWTVEHVVVPAGYRSTYPYDPSGKMPAPDDTPLPDPFVWLAFVAAATSRIKLGTGIAILPQRNPLIAAKEVATLDRLSGGRVLLGVGAGWLKEEFEALGVPFERRGRRLDEHIGAMRALWADEKASYDGELVRFAPCTMSPRPAAGRVPIHIGGHTDVAARRAGRLGDGFFPGTADLDELASALRVMRQAAEEAGRDPDAIEVTTGGPLDADGIKRLADLGVHRVTIPPLAFDVEGLRGGLGSFAEDVMPRVG
ncbi:MAG: putative F420-dependent oxidoreductase, Rv2161c family [Acidimicrobiales bacterium]|nr:putative F420-dependent oxidoreductase, Rv2161c family [Acidimicrobiales bacterium]